MAFLTEAANRGSIATGYDIDNSLKFESDNSEYLSRTPSSTTNRRTWTVSAWVKRTELGSNQVIISGGNYLNVTGVTILQFFADDTLNLYTHSNQLTTTRVFRDTSAWYHIVWAVDSTQSTAANRVNVYINGVQETSFSTENYPTQNWDSAFNLSSYENNIGRYSYERDRHFNGYMTDINFVDGQQLAPTEFGETDEDSGIWKPKAYDGTYGTNGFYLDFSDGANLGADTSGNGHTWSLNAIAAADQATDTPTNNFATLNVLNRNSGSSGVTNNSIFTEGNTKITGNLSAYWQSGVSTIGITSGKWYFEATPYDSNTKICTIGYGDEADIANWGKNNDFPGAAGSKSYGYTGGTTAGYGQISPSTNQPSPAVPYNQTNIIGVAIDADNGYVYWSKDGTFINSGNPASGSSGTGGIAVPTGAGTNGTLLPAVGFYYDGTIPAMVVNFGGYTQFTISSPASDANGYGTFEYAPPSGYYALCTKNLAEYG